MSASRCRFCSHDNPDGARFCNGCGSPLHLKPCPQCEAVNDVAASQCYECGVALESTAPENTVGAAAASAVYESPKSDNAPRPVPEAFGARLDNLPAVEAQANVAAAERRDAFARSNRTSHALFFAVLLLVFGTLGYYGYQRVFPPGGNDNDTATATSAPSENEGATTAREQTAAAPSSEPATPPSAPAAKPPAAPVKPASAAEAVATDARPATPRPGNKTEPTDHARPAPASQASAIATQQMIERYLGTRAGVSSPRSVQ
jgi:double zinc ribbon protein